MMIDFGRKLVAAALVGVVGWMPSARADAYHATPKLVIILVIDQFRGDYLDRYRDDLEGYEWLQPVFETRRLLQRLHV